MENEKPPGLRQDDSGRPFWRATKSAVKAGYPVKSVNLSIYAGDDVAIRDRCVRLQQEMQGWLSGPDRGITARFDGTFKSVLNVYETDPKSQYAKMKGKSQRVYNSYLKLMHAEIGACRIDRTDGTDVEGWFEFWAAAGEDGKRHIARARTAVAVLKAAIRFAVKKKFPGCAEFREVLRACQFDPLQSREITATADQVVAARTAAHAIGHPRAAFCYALQFEGASRQWDMRGQWLKLSEKAPSAVLGYGEKWIGPTWANVDQNLILRFKPTKTETTTGAEVVVDLRACPMVMEEMALIPEDERQGPLVVNVKTGLPYRDDTFGDIWRTVRTDAKIPSEVWNRDLRASGTTEARDADAKIDDLQKLMGHTEKSKTTSKVYDRAKLEAHRRIAAARTARRAKPE